MQACRGCVKGPQGMYRMGKDGLLQLMHFKGTRILRKSFRLLFKTQMFGGRCWDQTYYIYIYIIFIYIYLYIGICNFRMIFFFRGWYLANFLGDQPAHLWWFCYSYAGLGREAAPFMMGCLIQDLPRMVPIKCLQCGWCGNTIIFSSQDVEMYLYSNGFLRPKKATAGGAKTAESPEMQGQWASLTGRTN